MLPLRGVADRANENGVDLEAMATALEASGEYRVLRKLKNRPPQVEPNAQGLRTGLFVDVETTGLDPRHDEIIKLAMTRFYYSPIAGTTARAERRAHGTGMSRTPTKTVS